MAEFVLKPESYSLGLDIGTTSIGWSCVRLRSGKPSGIIASGVRLFDAGMSGSSVDFDRGKEFSHAVKRRQARLARRQIRRRSSRRWKVFRILQEAGLLPSEPIKRGADVSAFVEKLDTSLRLKFLKPRDHVSAQLLVYRIRSAATRETVEAFALGRAIMHLAKRRGFNSNLRGVPKDDEESGKVKPAIRSLGEDLKKTDSTLGAHLSTLNPFEKRIRQRWTGREMYLREFDVIWKRQSPHHPQMTEDLYKILQKAIFFQRPIRSAKGLVGKCSIEKKRRKLAAAHPLAQEVRMLQFLNNVRVSSRGEVDRVLSDQERQRAIEALSKVSRLSMTGFRSALGLNSKSEKLNYGGDEDSLARGLGTVSDFREILGEQWDKLSPQDQERLVYEVLSFTKRDALIRRAQKYWGFTQSQAELISELTLEPGYSSHCRAVLENLREKLSSFDEKLQRYPTYSEAKLAAYPNIDHGIPIYDQLPPVVKALPDLTNPAVIRALTEVRKVVNELIQRFGKPFRVHIELARDLKKSKKERKNLDELNREQASKRRIALQKIREEFTNYPEKKGYDRGVEMWLLAEECGWVCPYTAEPIRNVRDLLGDNSRFDIEHIFPRRYLDNSFANKTICLHEENRNVKRDRLPSLAYEGAPEKFDAIIKRVKGFKGHFASKKLARFLAREVPEGFVERQLNETRHTTVAAADYLGLIFGGRIDAEGRQRVFTLTGGLTAILRGQWKLNQILGLGDEKNRADHRHHAIDAIVAACTDMFTVSKLQKAAELGWQQSNTRSFPEIDPPWSSLLDDARRSVLSIVVSHRQHRRLNGPLHADTNYSPAAVLNGREMHKVRKPLASLSVTEIAGDAIVDPVIRRLVQEKYNELKTTLNAKEPKQAFAAIENHPAIPPKFSHTSLPTPIHSVRVWVKKKPTEVRKGDPTRLVDATQGSNFCADIVIIRDKHGKEIAWSDRVVSRLDALKTKNHSSDTGEIKFTLFSNDYVIYAGLDGKWQIYRVLSLAEKDIELRLHNDGRKSSLVEGGERVRLRGGALKSMCFRRVEVSPTGVAIEPSSGEIIDDRYLELLSAPNQTEKTSRKRKDT